MENKILAIASMGGHWIQLLRLMPAFELEQHELVFMTTKKGIADTIKDHKLYYVPDANRWTKLALVRMAYKVAKIVFIVRPKVIITTGAAPGLIGVIIGRIIGAKTIWIDSIANVEHLSLSCKIARFFASRIYTQWPHLTKKKIIFNGNVIS